MDTQKIIIVLLATIIAFFAINLYYINPRLSGEKPMRDFNKISEKFYDDYLALQEERVRIAALANEGVDEKVLLKQMETMYKQAGKAYDTLLDLHETAEKIELTDEQVIQALLAQPAYAGAGKDFAKNVIWNLPLVGRLAHGFDSTTDHLRLGLYKGYFNAESSGLVEAPEEYLAIFKKQGLKKPEDILTASPEIVTAIQREMRGHELGAYSEVDLAKAAIKSGISGVQAYFDGILLATGGKTMDIRGEVLKQLGVSSDLQAYMNIRLGEQTTQEYIEGVVKDKFLKLYEYVLTPKEIDSIMKGDIKEIQRVLSEIKDPDASFDFGIQESSDDVDVPDAVDTLTTKTIFGVSQTAIDVSQRIAKEHGINENTPYHKWPPEAQREAGQQLEILEERGPIMIVGKTDSGSVTPYLFPPGTWNLLTTSRDNTPLYMQGVQKKRGKTASAVYITTNLRNANKGKDIIEGTSTTLEELEEIGVFDEVEIIDIDIVDIPDVPVAKPPITSGSLSINVSKKNPKVGETVTIIVTAPSSFIPPITSNTSFGGQHAVAFDSSSGGRSISGTFIGSKPGIASGRITVTDSQGNKASGSVSITVGCESNWECSDWSVCSNSKQARTCNDANSCGINNEKPATSQSCSGGGSGDGSGLCSGRGGGSGNIVDTICSGQRPQAVGNPN